MMLTLVDPEPLSALPAICDDIAASLVNARSAAEILTARQRAAVTYDVAKRAARFAASEDLHREARRIQARALELQAAGDVRLADEFDAGQERGDIATGRDGPGAGVLDGNAKATAEELGLSRKQIHEARLVRNAERADPGIVHRALEERLAQELEPNKAALREIVIAAAQRGLRPEPKSSRRNPHYEHDPQFEVMASLTGCCRTILAHAAEHPTAFILGGFLDDGMRERNLTTIRECRDYLTALLEEASNVVPRARLESSNGCRT